MLWSSNIPNRYKRNAINADPYRSRLISTNVDMEISLIKKKLSAADNPQKFIEMSLVVLTMVT